MSGTIETRVGNSGGGGSGAKTDLSNLVATSVNQSIIPSTDNSIDLGSSSKHWANVYAALTVIAGGPSVAYAKLLNTNGQGGALVVYAGSGQNFQFYTDGVSGTIGQLGAGLLSLSTKPGTHSFYDGGNGVMSTLTTTGLNLLVAGQTVSVKSGTNAKAGVATLVAGTVTVSTTAVTANSMIFVGVNTPGGTPGSMKVTAVTVGTSFVITSTSGTDTSVVGWWIVEKS